MHILIQQLEKTLTGRFGLCVVIDLEANSPHRTDNIPNHTEESDQLTELSTNVDYKPSAGDEQDDRTHAGEKLHHRKISRP